MKIHNLFCLINFDASIAFKKIFQQNTCFKISELIPEFGDDDYYDYEEYTLEEAFFNQLEEERERKKKKKKKRKKNNDYYD